MEPLCLLCKGKNLCGRKFCAVLNSIKEFAPKKVGLNFSGSSPPDLFVGRIGYPQVYTGILAPAQHNEESYKLSSPEEWYKANFSIEDILKSRGSLVYCRFTSSIKKPEGKLLGTMQEISMASKPCDVEFFLKKKPKVSMEFDLKVPPIGNPAPLIKARLQENPKIEKRVDYLVNDNGIKAAEAILDLYKHEQTVTSITKLLSSGLLGLKFQRKLVPSRWSISCVDDTISKSLLKKVRDYPWVNEFMLFSGAYLGNHYEVLLMPRQWSFEVIEAKAPGSCWNPGLNVFFMKDYEGFWDRKQYAHEVTGAYYSNRLAIAEYLEKIKRQASALILREVRDEYWAPCGVGILRELSRDIFNKPPKTFKTIKEALEDIKTRFIIPVEKFIENSKLCKEINTQKTLSSFSM